MNITNKNIVNTRKYIKNKLLSDTKFKRHENERLQIMQLLKQTIEAGESNSALLIGPRGVGKTTLLNDVLQEIQTTKSFHRNAILVWLHGLIHTDDRLALKTITTQMNLDNAVDGKVFGSFAENLAFLLACLKTGQKEKSKSIVFILDEFDLFCAHHNQTLLYNLFDVSQSAQTPLCIIGVTCRLDVIELFEKRVKSRFSHRQLFLFSGDGSKSELKETTGRIEQLLYLHDSKVFCSHYIAEWNKHIKHLSSDKKFCTLIQRLTDIDCNERILKNIICQVISRLNDNKLHITIQDFEEQCKIFENDDLISTIQDLSTLEVCLVIAMLHHLEIYNGQSFNFEMILTRYTTFANKNSNMQSVQRSVVLKAFEHLQKMELISSVTTSNRLQKEYQLFKLLITSQQIIDAIKQMPGLPTEVVQWANSSLT